MKRFFCNVRTIFISLLVFCLFGLFSNTAIADTQPSVVWERLPINLSGMSQLTDSATDSSGNVYSVGYIGDGEFDFGNDVTVTGAYDGGYDPVVIKYNSEGVAQWAKSTTTAVEQAYYNDVEVDSLGNVFVVGSISKNNEYGFGNGVTATGQCDINDNAVLVKYNSSGDAQWAKSATVAPNVNSFSGIAIDGSNNVYASGMIFENGQYDFGNGATASGSAGESYNNALIVKYNSSGDALWAKSTMAGFSSLFYGINVNSSGIYAVGSIYNGEEYDFGNGATVSAAYADYSNGVIVKYDSFGNAQWAESTVAALTQSNFNDVDLDLDGNLYIAGEIYANSEFDFGNNVTVTGAAPGGRNGYWNALVIKYNSSGVAQWAKSTVAALNTSSFLGIAVDSAGNSYASGSITGDGEYDFGNGVTISGALPFDPLVADGNAVIVKYNSSGIPQWAKSTETASGASSFTGVSVDSNGNAFAAGSITGTDTYNFGDGDVNGTNSGSNIILIKYFGGLEESSTPTPSPTSTTQAVTSSSPLFSYLPNDTRTINIDENQTITTNPFIIKVKPSDDDGIDRVEFFVDDNLICTSTSADSDGVYSCSWDTSKYHSVIKVYAYDTKGNRSEVLTRITSVDPTLYLKELPATGRGDN